MATEATGDLDPRKTVVLDRRTFNRVPPLFEAVVVRTKVGTHVAAKVENVSQGGIGLHVESANEIRVNDHVDVIYNYAVLPAIVRHVESQADETAQLGLEWTVPPAA